MRRVTFVVLLSFAVAAPVQAVTFTRITTCCAPGEFNVAHPAWSSDPNKIAATFITEHATDVVWITTGALTANGVRIDGYTPAVNFAAGASWAPDAAQYVCQWGGNWVAPRGLLIVDASGAHTQLTLGQEMEPAWSPDGSSIAFRDNGIWVMPAMGGMPVPVTAQGGRQPAWTSDGEHIVYSEAGDLWSIPALGGAAVQLTNHPANDMQPACSPNGLWLAFTSNRNGSDDVYVMPIAGGAPVRITTDPADDRSPSWAPGSDRIAFWSQRDGNPNIWIAADLPDFTVAVEARTWTALKHLYRGTSR